MRKLAEHGLKDSAKPLQKNAAFEKFVNQHILTGETHPKSKFKGMNQCLYDEATGQNIFYALTPAIIKLLRKSDEDDDKISVE